MSPLPLTQSLPNVTKFVVFGSYNFIINSLLSKNIRGFRSDPINIWINKLMDQKLELINHQKTKSIPVVVPPERHQTGSPEAPCTGSLC